MSRFRRVMKASWELLKESKRYSDERIEEAWKTPESLHDVAVKYVQKLQAPAPLIAVLGTYLSVIGLTGLGIYKGGEFVYDKINDKISENKIEKIVRDIPNMALPIEYGFPNESNIGYALPPEYGGIRPQ